MKVLRATKTAYKSQDFYGNRACARIDTNGRPFIPWQIKTEVAPGICPVGYKKFYPLVGLQSHGGDDWVTVFKEPVHFNVDAEGESEWELYSINEDPGYGLYLEIRSLSPLTFKDLPPEAGPEARQAWKNQGGKIHVKFIYTHAHDNIPSKIGEKITTGQLIQLSNSTGASSGNHVDQRYKFCDADGNTLDRNNGWNGAVSLPKELDRQDIYVLDFLELPYKLSLNLRLLQALLQLQILMMKAKSRIGALFG